MHTTDGIDELFNLVYNADGLTVKSIHFPEYFGTCTSGGQTPCYVYANGSGPLGTLPVGQSTGAEVSAFHKLLTPTVAHAAPAPTRTTPANRGAHHRPGRAAPHAPSTAGLVADPSDGKSQAALLGHSGCRCCTRS